MTRAIIAAACVCHFALIVAGAAHQTARVQGAAGRALRFYDVLTGAGDSYSFFAPAVGPQLRARFTLSTRGGDRVEETLEDGKSREVSVRGDTAEECWRIVAPVLSAWGDGEVPLEDYPAGSDGPSDWPAIP